MKKAVLIQLRKKWGTVEFYKIQCYGYYNVSFGYFCLFGASLLFVCSLK